jgi:hypothetical protein
LETESIYNKAQESNWGGRLLRVSYWVASRRHGEMRMVVQGGDSADPNCWMIILCWDKEENKAYDMRVPKSGLHGY